MIFEPRLATTNVELSKLSSRRRLNTLRRRTVHVQLTRAIARRSRTRTTTRTTLQLLRTLHVAAVSALHVAVICALHVAVRTLQFERSRSRSCSMVGIQCIVQSERRGDKRPTAKPKPFSSVMLKGCINSHKHSNCQDCPKKNVLDLPATLGEPWLL